MFMAKKPWTSMKWGLRIRIIIYFLVLGGLAYMFLGVNGSIQYKLYALFTCTMASIMAGLILEVNPFNPFWRPDDEEQ